MVSEQEYREVEAFIFKEARYADESAYDDWEALWEDDAKYWVPTSPDADTEVDISHIFDNRSRIATRIRQLKSGFRHSQTPCSPMRRIISNIEISPLNEHEYEVAANFMLMELAVQSTRDMNLWGGAINYRLRRVEGELRLFYKKIMLVDADEPIANLAFLI
ncbi:MAG: nuclear transport factor 2 family protein [Pseudomonadales bacterium]|nr:nuclear transport factor 2 family protein [Pseudomonadales bacterium]